MLKTCNVCCKQMPATSEFFPIWGKHHKGFRPLCKVCKAAQAKAAWVQKHGPNRQSYVVNGKKRCRRCGETKPVEQFTKTNKGRSRLPNCKPCYAIICKQKRAASIDVYRRREAERMRAKRRNIEFKLAETVKSRIYEALRGTKKSKRTFDIIGYSVQTLKAHLERTFLPGMTWENHGKVWHIDHIVPVSAFDHSDVEQIRQCWALTNLRALGAAENVAKSNKRLYLL